ncbi:MAG: DNA-binding protein [Alphaproteobacteria bacterium]|nr:MAG: DNA-binding protein [Alphaproteobacteria bacterium]
MARPNQIPIAEGLFTWPDDNPRLIGSRCRACGEVTFPHQPSCPACCAEDTEDYLLARKGTLWTWTTQGFLPKSPPYAGPETPETFRPYGVGYVELPGEVRVEARLTESDPEKLGIGMAMELVVVPFATDSQGNEIVTFAFAPVPKT